MNPEMALQDDGCLRLRYFLHDLPTAQHKAGLAGLLCLSRSMHERGLAAFVEIAAIDARSAEIVFGLDALNATFEDLYDAKWQEQFSPRKFPYKEPKRVEEVPVGGGTLGQTANRFVYDIFRPSGAFFTHLFAGGERSPWLKLWQDMLWAVLRAQPAARGNYKARANGEPLTIADKTWADLLKALKARGEGKVIVRSVAGSLYVGAQDTNAEQVQFQGLVELNLLLHFWQLVTPVFAPRVIDVKNRRMVDQGYLLVVPDVADLREFLWDIDKFWRSREVKISGYRPKQALIDVPPEGGLEFLYDLARLRADRDLSMSVSAIEWYHQEKQGNNVRMHGQGRLPVDRDLLRRYENARERRASPLFKYLVLGNLLAGRAWHQGAANLFAGYPTEFFIYTNKSPRNFAFFGADVHGRFIANRKDAKAQENDAMTDTQQTDLDDILVRRVYDLIGTYVRHRAQERSHMKRDQFGKDEHGYTRYPKEYSEAVEKVAKDAFLAMRGRNDREFVNYFTGTICSVPQYFGSQNHFVALSQALITQSDLVKGLAMLALSAHSWTPRNKSDTDAEAA